MLPVLVDLAESDVMLQGANTEATRVGTVKRGWIQRTKTTNQVFADCIPAKTPTLIARNPNTVRSEFLV